MKTAQWSRKPSAYKKYNVVSAEWGFYGKFYIYNIIYIYIKGPRAIDIDYNMNKEKKIKYH